MISETAGCAISAKRFRACPFRKLYPRVAMVKSPSTALATMLVTNDIVFEGRPSLDADAGKTRPQGRTEDFPDILAMKNRAHAGHLFRCRGMELYDSAVGDRRPDRDGVKLSRKVEVGSVPREAAHFERAVNARRRATNWRRGRVLRRLYGLHDQLLYRDGPAPCLLPS